MKQKTEELYALSYYAGVQTLRLLHRSGRFFAFILQPILFFLRRTLGNWLRRLGEGLREGFAALGDSFSRVGERVGAAWKRHPMEGVLAVLLLPVVACRRHRRGAGQLLRIGTALVALAVLIGTLQYWNGITYAMALTVDGDVWGYVTDEDVLTDGAAMAQERAVGTVEWQGMAVQPTMSLSMTHEDAVLDKTQVCDLLLESSDLSLIRACGIYVDGVLQGAVRDGRRAQELLQDILDESCEGRDGVTASFFQEVELVEGLYPTDSIHPTQTMKERLMSAGSQKEFYTVKAGDTFAAIESAIGVSAAEIHRLNPTMGAAPQVGQTLLIKDSEPHLKVLVSGTIQYEVEVPFATQRMADASLYKGVERTRVKGKNGISRITATVVYLDGEELYSSIVSSDVIEEPITRVVAYGTKEKYGKTYKGGKYATGRFIWPVPYTRNITQHFGSAGGHGALDISENGIHRKNIVASDGGTVVTAAYRKGTSYGSYGKYIVIDHGGGYQTLYAHCDELLVSPGDIVEQGQVIGLVGNTGRSTNSHLHFEIQINGRRVNPMTYLSR